MALTPICARAMYPSFPPLVLMMVLLATPFPKELSADRDPAQWTYGH